MTFTAAAADNCGVRRVFVRRPYCFQVDDARQRVEVPCRVSIDGDSMTIRRSGAVGTRIRWWATAVDTSRNRINRRCGVNVVTADSG